MALFTDRRGGATMVDVTNPADSIRGGLKRPDKPGQYTRAKLSRLDSVHRDVQSGRAAVINPGPSISPVPGVVHNAVHSGSRTVLPDHPRARGFRGLMRSSFGG